MSVADSTSPTDTLVHSDRDSPYHQAIGERSEWKDYGDKDATLAIDVDLDGNDGSNAERGIAGQATLKEAPITSTVTAQDWTGPDDLENPHNWSMSKRMYNTLGTGLTAFSAYVFLHDPSKTYC